MTDEDEESWMIRRDAGKVATPPLSLAIRMLPTPHGFSQDGKSNGPSGNELGFALNHPSTFSQLGGHVLPFPVQGKEEELRMIVGSGRRSLERYEKSGRGILWGKMFLACLVLKTEWYSRECALTWKLRVTPFKRLLFQLVPKVRRTEGTVFGLLGTPVAQDDNKSPEAHMRMKANMKGGPRYKATSLQVQIARLPTPTDSMATMQDMVQAKFHSSKRPRYKDAVLPTPSARDWKSEKCSDETYDRNSRVLSETLGKNTGMRLHPDFVEFLMGYPEGWTELID